jgi:hypothetical protein
MQVIRCKFLFFATIISYYVAGLPVDTDVRVPSLESFNILFLT